MTIDISNFAADLTSYSGQPGFSYDDEHGLQFYGTAGTLILNSDMTWEDNAGAEWRLEFPQPEIPSDMTISLESGAKFMRIKYGSDGTLTWAYNDGAGVTDTDTQTAIDLHFFLFARVGTQFRAQSSPDGVTFDDLFTAAGMANDTDVWTARISDANGRPSLARFEGFNTNNPTTSYAVPQGTTFVSGVNSGGPNILRPPSLPGYVKPVWTFATGYWLDGPAWEITQLKTRTITLSLDSPDRVEISVGGSSPEAKFVHEMQDDLWVHRNGEAIFRGRIMNSEDGGGTTYDVTFEAESYAAMLRYRMVHPVRSLAGKRLGDINQITFPVTWTPIQIVRWLILHSESHYGMQLGLKLGAEIASPWLGIPPFALPLGLGSDTLPSWDVKTGQTILEAIQELQTSVAADINGSSDTRTGLGFDFWIDEELTVHVALIRGKDNTNSTTLDYGGIISDFTRAQRAEDYGNVLLATSDDANVPLPYWVPSETSAKPLGTPMQDTNGPGDATHSPPFLPGDPTPGGYTAGVGGWETSRSYQASTAIGLGAQARSSYAQISRVGNGNFSFNATFVHGGWEGPDHVWLGDYVTFRAKRGRINVNQVMRVIGMTISIDPNGVETVQVQLEYNRDRIAALNRFKAAVKKAITTKQAKKK